MSSAIQPVTPRHIATHIARNAWHVGQIVRAFRRTPTPRQRDRALEQLARELDAARYWMAVLLDDSDQSGTLLRHALVGTHDLLDLAAHIARTRL
jgi:hypothetical protein